MSRPFFIMLHASVAGVFFFALQKYALDSDLGEALLWSFGAGGIAGFIAYKQSEHR
jgi:hypothetical protein